MTTIPYLAFGADIARRLTLRARFGPGFDLACRAMRAIGALALRKGWRHNYWPSADRVFALRPDGRTFGAGNPWREMSPAISMAAALKMAEG